LVLIEHTDHMRIHCAPGNRLEAKKFNQKGPRPVTLARGRVAYETAIAGTKWSDLDEHSYGRARLYAASEGLPWPIASKRRWTAKAGWIDA
jgi:hypothetical protein